KHNKVYRKFCDLLKTDVMAVKSIDKIPFLPISFFKSTAVLSSNKPVEITFTSSGTTGQNTSSHLVTDVSVYEQSYLQGFAEFYGNIEDYVVLRSEEHTSELQSRENLVCRLLLEKKKKKE